MYSDPNSTGHSVTPQAWAALPGCLCYWSGDCVDLPENVSSCAWAKYYYNSAPAESVFHYSKSSYSTGPAIWLWVSTGGC